MLQRNIPVVMGQNDTMEQVGTADELNDDRIIIYIRHQRELVLKLRNGDIEYIKVEIVMAPREQITLLPKLGLEQMYAVTYDTHPNEPTGRKVAFSLARDPVPGIARIQANKMAWGKRFLDEELTSAFGTGATTYEGIRSRELEVMYRNYEGVIDVHNNATMPETYGMIGPNSSPVTLKMAWVLGIKNIVVLGYPEWPDYKYFDLCPNLLVVEGKEDSPMYSADRWHEHLERIPGAPELRPEDYEFKFFRRLRDITWVQAREGRFDDLTWSPSFSTPLPLYVQGELSSSGDSVYALSWPDGDNVGYAPPESDLDYFGEAVEAMDGSSLVCMRG